MRLRKFIDQAWQSQPQKNLSVQYGWWSGTDSRAQEPDQHSDEKVQPWRLFGLADKYPERFLSWWIIDLVDDAVIEYCKRLGSVEKWISSINCQAKHQPGKQSTKNCQTQQDHDNTDCRFFNKWFAATGHITPARDQSHDEIRGWSRIQDGWLDELNLNQISSAPEDDAQMNSTATLKASELPPHHFWTLDLWWPGSRLRTTGSGNVQSINSADTDGLR